MLNFIKELNFLKTECFPTIIKQYSMNNLFLYNDSDNTLCVYIKKDDYTIEERRLIAKFNTLGRQKFYDVENDIPKIYITFASYIDIEEMECESLQEVLNNLINSKINVVERKIVQQKNIFSSFNNQSNEGYKEISTKSIDKPSLISIYNDIKYINEDQIDGEKKYVFAA